MMRKLPIKMFAYSPCYRREAGSYRSEERGTIRGHQFNKVEMFQFTAPEQAEGALSELVGRAQALVEKLVTVRMRQAFRTQDRAAPSRASRR